MFQQPPAAGDQIKLADLLGSLILIYVRDYRQGIVTSSGVTDAIAADVHVLQGNGAGDSYENTLLFGKALVPSLQSTAGGEPVLGRIGQGIAKPGQTAPWVLNPYTEQDALIATAWIQSRKPGVQQPKTDAKPAAAPAAAAPASANGTSGIDVSSLPPEVAELLRQAGHVS